MNITVEVPITLENAAPYSLNIGEGMRVPMNEEKAIFETIIRLTGNVFFVLNPLLGPFIHIGGSERTSEDGDNEFSAKTGEKLPPGTIIKFTL